MVLRVGFGIPARLNRLLDPDAEPDHPAAEASAARPGAPEPAKVNAH